VFEGIDEKTRDLQQQLDQTNDELERLREDRVRQSTMVETSCVKETCTECCCRKVLRWRSLLAC
jgi:hypothetical protein